MPDATWWRDPRARDELEAAVALINDARSAPDDLSACDHYMRAAKTLLVRDREVERQTRAMFDDLVEAVLDEPAHRLVAYGSLLPGRSNASVLRGVDGSWSPVALVGTIRDVDGFPVFRSTRAAGEVAAQVLSSELLTPTAWQRLDEFEGSNYRRQLVVYTDRTAAELGVANCYVGAEPRAWPSA